MKTVVEDQLALAEDKLAEAREALRAGFHKYAAREAYLVAFHAALAILFERKQAEPKTHKGTHALFSQIALDDPDLTAPMTNFLGRAYLLKQIQDYGPAQDVTAQEAEEALAQAAEFLTNVEIALARTMDPRQCP